MLPLQNRIFITATPQSDFLVPLWSGVTAIFSLWQSGKRKFRRIVSYCLSLFFLLMMAAPQVKSAASPVELFPPSPVLFVRAGENFTVWCLLVTARPDALNSVEWLINGTLYDGSDPELVIKFNTQGHGMGTLHPIERTDLHNTDIQCKGYLRSSRVFVSLPLKILHLTPPGTIDRNSISVVDRQQIYRLSPPGDASDQVSLVTHCRDSTSQTLSVSGSITADSGVLLPFDTNDITDDSGSGSGESLEVKNESRRPAFMAAHINAVYISSSFSGLRIQWAAPDSIPGEDIRYCIQLNEPSKTTDICDIRNTYFDLPIMPESLGCEGSNITITPRSYGYALDFETGPATTIELSTRLLPVNCIEKLPGFPGSDQGDMVYSYQLPSPEDIITSHFLDCASGNVVEFSSPVATEKEDKETVIIKIAENESPPNSLIIISAQTRPTTETATETLTTEIFTTEAFTTEVFTTQDFTIPALTTAHTGETLPATADTGNEITTTGSGPTNSAMMMNASDRRSFLSVFITSSFLLNRLFYTDTTLW